MKDFKTLVFIVIFLSSFITLVSAQNGPPNITSVTNSRTGTNADFIMEVFNSNTLTATANQSITTWKWFVNGINQNNNASTYTYNSSVRGSAQITVNATNTNGTSATVLRNVTIKQAPEIRYIVTVKSIEATIIEEKDTFLLGGFTQPEIRPHIELKAKGNPIPALYLAWMAQEGQTNETILNQNGTFVFEQKILLNGEKWKYPFDKYEAVIYIQPPYILNKTIKISLSSDGPYEGIAKFEPDNILLSIKRNDDIINSYIFILIISMVWVFYSIRYIKNLKEDSFQSGKELEHISRIGGPFLAYIIFFKIINSIGFIPFAVMVLGLTLYYFKRKKSLHS